MRVMGWMLGVAASLAASQALAKDSNPCPKDMICASDPTSVAAAVMKSGYQGLLSKDDLGDPKIDSAAAGYRFQLLFYGCDDHKACDSLQFHASFTPEPPRLAEFANEWNGRKRFTQMAVNQKGEVRLTYDLATIGGINARNFADVMEWWTSMLGEFAKFDKEHPVAASAPAVPRPGAAPTS